MDYTEKERRNIDPKMQQEEIKEIVSKVKRNFTLKIILRNADKKDVKKYLQLYDTDPQKAYAFLGLINDSPRKPIISMVG